MASRAEEPKLACCLLYGEKLDFLHSLVKELSGGKPVEETQIVCFDDTVALAITSEIELESKYNVVRLRIIACNKFEALLTENGIRTVYQYHSEAKLPPVCSTIVVCHDSGSSQNSDLNRMKQCSLSLISKWSPEGRIILGVPNFLALENGSMTEKNQFATWCVQHEIEFVEMESPYGDGDSFCEDGRELEEYGCKRMLSALTVSAAFAKFSPPPWNHNFRHLSSSTSSSSASDQEEEKVESTYATSKVSEDAEQFDALFSRLVSMKEKCQAMPEGDQRHAYAEKVVTAFWKAIGGADDEIGSSRSSSPVSSSKSSDSDSDVEHLIPVPTDNSEAAPSTEFKN